jgi:hypothetical protein
VVPEATVVADLLAVGTDGHDAAERLHVGQRLLQLLVALAQLLGAGHDLFAQVLLHALALDDAPDGVGQQLRQLDIVLVVRRLLVAHAQRRGNAPFLEHRHTQVAQQDGVALRQSLAVRLGGVVVVDDGFAAMHAVDPDACLRDGIVRGLDRGADPLRAGGPGVQPDGGLVGIDEVEIADAAVGQAHRLVEPPLDDLVDGGAVDQLEQVERGVQDIAGAFCRWRPGAGVIRRRRWVHAWDIMGTPLRYA